MRGKEMGWQERLTLGAERRSDNERNHLQSDAPESHRIGRLWRVHECASRSDLPTPELGVSIV